MCRGPRPCSSESGACPCGVDANEDAWHPGECCPECGVAPGALPSLGYLKQVAQQRGTAVDDVPFEIPLKPGVPR